MQLGIIGYHINSGIGSLIDDVKEFLPVSSHFVVPQRQHGIDYNKPSNCKLVIPGNAVNEQLCDWIAEQDCIICAEFPPHAGTLMLAAKKANTPVVCIVDIDWFNPKDAWVKDIALFVCPNLYTLQRLSLYGIRNTAYIPGCVDTDYFSYQPKDICFEFLFNNGWGGYRRRKGLDIVEQTAALTSASVYINSQQPVSSKLNNIRVYSGNLPERKSLFTRGQIYLAPTRCEGYGLHILEAMACGYPVITTAGKPMTDYVLDSALHINAVSTKQCQEARFSALWCEPSAQHLAVVMQRFLDKSVKLLSEQTREHIEKHHSWKKNVVLYTQQLERLCA